MREDTHCLNTAAALRLEQHLGQLKNDLPPSAEEATQGTTTPCLHIPCHSPERAAGWRRSWSKARAMRPFMRPAQDPHTWTVAHPAERGENPAPALASRLPQPPKQTRLNLPPQFLKEILKELASLPNLQQCTPIIKKIL